MISVIFLFPYGFTGGHQGITHTFIHKSSPLAMLGCSVWYLHMYPTDHIWICSPHPLTVVKDFLFDKDLMLSARSFDAVQDKCP